MLINIIIKKSKIIKVLWSLQGWCQSFLMSLTRKTSKYPFLNWKVSISKGLKRKSDVKICLPFSKVQTIPIKCRKTCQYLPLAEFAHPHLSTAYSRSCDITLLISTLFPQHFLYWLSAALKHARITINTNLGLCLVSCPKILSTIFYHG